MTINLHLPPRNEALKPTITVFGVGGAGGNAVTNMITSDLQGVNFVVANTDAQALERSACERRIQLGINVTRGLGAGASPDVGGQAAEEAIDEISEYIEGSNMVFITAGMGGGTGTGAAPVIARMAREQGILTVGVVTKPFHFEGTHRMRIADYGLEELQKYVDTLIVIPNQNLFRVANEHTTFADAFKMADEVLHSGVRGVTDLMVMPGLINLDFADIRAVMREMGKAMMGTGEAGGDKRAIEAAEAAISNPLLDDVSMKGARGVLINITGGPDMTLFEVDEAANRIRDEVDPEANIIFGSTFNSEMEGSMRVSVVATGIEAAERTERPPFRNSNASQQTSGGAQKRETRSDSNGGKFNFPASKPRVAAAPAASNPEPVASSGNSSNAAASVPNFSRARSEAVAVKHEDLHEEEFSLQMQEPEPMQPQQVAQEQVQGEDVAAEPSFIPPRAAQPSQRSHHVSRPMDEDRANGRPARPSREEGQEDGSKRMNFFQRMTNMGTTERGGRDEAPAPRRVEVTETKKADIRDTKAATGGEEDYLDIPAFLRRQAN
ncbi:MAG: cell division protein FtsZ [Alphaproteobacteria bacterium]|nr:cell division protein FtsZ [Alphaproteobacteria bacterium]